MIETSRQAKVEAIISFLHQHGECQAARAICRELLGEHVPLDDEVRKRLSALLAREPREQIDRFFDLVT